MLTASGMLKEIILSCNNNKIAVNWRHIYMNLNWSFKRTNGFFLSPNKALVGVVTTYCRMLLANKDDKDVIITLYANKAVKPLELVLNNPTNCLTYYWDCLEVLR